MSAADSLFRRQIFMNMTVMTDRHVCHSGIPSRRFHPDVYEPAAATAGASLLTFR